MKKVIFSCSLIILLAVSALAQKSVKPWTEWSQKDAEKIWNDSAWAQTQTEGGGVQESSQSSAISSTTAARENQVKSTSAASKAGESGDKKEGAAIHYRVRLLTAKPIRAAFVRLVQLQGANEERVAQLRTFIDRDLGDYIVVTISADGDDQKRKMAIAQALTSADANALKDVTYLERKDGKRIQLLDYRAPAQDALGAKLVFPRTVDGQPFIDTNSGEVRFGLDLGKIARIKGRFKVAEMMYDGKLEF